MVDLLETPQEEPPEAPVALDVPSMLGAVLRESDLWSIVPAGIGEAIAKTSPSHAFLPLVDCLPPGPDAHVLLPEKTLPWVEDAISVLMDAVAETIAQDANLAPS